MYTFYADLIASIHLAILAFVVIGELLILVGWGFGWRWVRNRWFRLIHLATILFVVYEAVIGMQCPLTTWEDDLRRLAGTPANEHTFVGRIVQQFMCHQLPFDHPLLVNSYYIFGALVLLTLIMVPPRLRKGRGEEPPADEGPLASDPQGA